MSEEDNVLTFGELRKKQKEEEREEELTELDEKFMLRASSYLERKKEEGGESREYKNARRKLDKIVSLREQKIVKKAILSVKTDLKASKLDLLPEEQELFRELKNTFQNHRKRIDEALERTEVERDIPTRENSQERKSAKKGEEKSQEENEGENKSEDGYRLVKITSEVPEFMGTDLEAYGPFERGEEVEIPEDNAEILMNRGNAELIEE